MTFLILAGSVPPLSKWTMWSRFNRDFRSFGPVMLKGVRELRGGGQTGRPLPVVNGRLPVGQGHVWQGLTVERTSSPLCTLAAFSAPAFLLAVVAHAVAPCTTFDRTPANVRRPEADRSRLNVPCESGNRTGTGKGTRHVSRCPRQAFFNAQGQDRKST